MHAHHHPYTTLLTHLTTQLPHSGPLLRRIQYQVTHPSPTAQVLATFVPGSDPESDPSTPWLAAYADVHRGPDTQVWLFSSIETKSNSNSNSNSATSGSGPGPGSPHNNVSNTITTTKEKETAKSQLLSLFTLIQSRLIPSYLTWAASQTQPDQSQEKEEGVKKIPAHSKTSFLIGTAHKDLVGLVCELASEGRVRIHRGQNFFYAKYCFPTSSFHDNSDNGIHGETGSGYRFTDSNGVSGIQERHLDLVKSRTNIPRSKRALLEMGGVALYYDSPAPVSGSGEEMPIAWAFLGFDGSLSTLHVEPEHRGKGLGGIVGREVMKKGAEVFEPGTKGNSGEGEEWFYADVAVENLASRRVMEKMGGKAQWTVAWMVVEVDDVDKI